jgi:hypothetical protein
MAKGRASASKDYVESTEEKAWRNLNGEPSASAPIAARAIMLKSRRARPAPVEEVKKLPVEVEDEEAAETEEAGVEEVEDDVGVDDLEEEAEEVVQDEDDVLLEDASELGEDEDMGEVVDMEGEDEER